MVSSSSSSSSSSPSAHVIPPYVSLLAGMSSGILGNFLLQPLDVAKTSLINPQGNHSGMFALWRSIYQSHGIQGVWRGSGPAVTRISIGAGVYFCVQSTLLSQLKHLKAATTEVSHTTPTSTTTTSATVPSSHVTLSSFELLVVGFCSRASAVSVCCPISVVKTRIEGSSVRPYRSLLHGLTSIYKTEGMRGLYTGLLPSVLKDSPYAAVYLLLYSNLKQMITPSVLAWTSGGDLSQKDSKKESPVVQFIAAFTAGGIATTFFHPSEVIKTRLQLMKLQEIAQAAAVTATTTTTTTAMASASAQPMVPTLPRHRVLFIARIILQENGVKGFFRGLLPRVMKRSLSNALGWMTYEQLVQMWTGVAAGL